MSPTLPGPSGLDHLRCMVDFVRHPYETLLAQHRRFGPVIQIGFGHVRLVYLLGPEANQLIMAERADNFRWREAYDVLVPIAGETALIVSDGQVHKRRRRLVQPAFHKNRLDAYLQFVTESVDDTLKGFTPGRTLDIYQELRSTIRRIVIRSLFGENLARQSETLGRLIQDMLDFVNMVLVPQIKLELPGLPYRKFMRARRALDELVYAEIARRRAAPDEGDDVMALLLATRDESGDSLSDVEVRDQVVSLITAGYETTSAALGWAMYSLLVHPEMWEQASAEARRLPGDRPPTTDDLAKLTYLDGIISETLRLYPSVFIGVRKAAEAFTFQGHAIPAGSMVAYSPYVTHRIPSLYPDPERFDPARWDLSAPGRRAPTPYEYVPFGGGSRRCIGAGFALLDMKAVLARVLGSTRLSLVSRTVTPTGFSAMYPKEGISVRVEAR
jgi:cytochrome P450